MARSLNKAILIGNLGADPEVRSTSSGSRLAQFSLATSRSWTDAQGDEQERTEWHRVVVWGKLVEVVEQYLKKGERVYVEGEIQYGSYEDSDGVTRYTTEIRARELMMLGGRGEDAPQEEPVAAPAPARAAAKGGRGGGRARVPAGAGAGRAPKVAVPAEDDDLPF